jgi:hypothetical protein
MPRDITHELPPAIARHLAACNGHDIDAWMATFDPDALVNDVQREFAGAEAIRAFAANVLSTHMANIDIALLRHCRCQRFRVFGKARGPPQVPVAQTAQALRRVVGLVANARAQPHCHSSNVRAYKDASP